MNKLKLNIPLVLLLCVGINYPAHPETVTVTVPSTASGGFGTPASGYVPLVKALTVKSAGTITISYQSGTVDVPGTPHGGWCSAGASLCQGPNGGDWDAPYGWALPLEQASGVAGQVHLTNDMALIGAFVPQSLVKTTGFQALDGTKFPIGIMPDKLFFVGSYNVIQVSGPGTLYLGVNDMYDDDNVGSLTVKVTGQSDENTQ